MSASGQHDRLYTGLRVPTRRQLGAVDGQCKVKDMGTEQGCIIMALSRPVRTVHNTPSKT